MLTFGWREAFVILGVISLLWVVLWLWLYRDNPRDHWLVNEAEAALLEQTAMHPGRAKSERVPWKALLKNLWPVTLVDFCYGWSLWVFLTWIPTYLRIARGFDLKDIALFGTLPLIGGVFGDTLGGLLTDYIWRCGHQRTARGGQIAIFLVLSLCFALPAAFVTSPIAAVWLLSLSFFCLEMTNAPLWALPMDVAPHYSGIAGGMMNTGFGVAGIISPIIFGAIVEHTGNWALPWIVSSVLLIAGAVVACFVDPTRLVISNKQQLEPARAVR
jgi:ACS family D-galactonate transporter-like MFS transporter